MILGPCGIESEKMYFKTLEYIAKIELSNINFSFLYKASFDKANRTSIEGERGVGLKKAIKIFEKAREKFPEQLLTTDVHEVWQVEALQGLIDCIQIPAFLCRQTDLIVECAKYFNVINIKKGQWLGVNNVIKSVDKVRLTNPNAKVWITERGSSFGDSKLIVDFSIVDELKKHYDKVIFDVTHSTQHSKTVYGTSGDRELAMRYFLAAYSFGYDGIFAEVHKNPEKAISDSDCQIRLKELASLIQATIDIDKRIEDYENERCFDEND
jgi:2-dehydro-3-deoxyphosphooctonate aldolase (KDO 8-P synthase)